jgi:hypothetical protein
MRRDVKEVVEEEAAAGDIFTHDGSEQSTNTAVPILSLSLLLKQFVQMGQNSSQDLCFQVHHSVPNGSKNILILCMTQFLFSSRF